MNESDNINILTLDYLRNPLILNEIAERAALTKFKLNESKEIIRNAIPTMLNSNNLPDCKTLKWLIQCAGFGIRINDINEGEFFTCNINFLLNIFKQYKNQKISGSCLELALASLSQSFLNPSFDFYYDQYIKEIDSIFLSKVGLFKNDVMKFLADINLAGLRCLTQKSYFPKLSEFNLRILESLPFESTNDYYYYMPHFSELQNSPHFIDAVIEKFRYYYNYQICHYRSNKQIIPIEIQFFKFLEEFISTKFSAKDKAIAFDRTVQCWIECQEDNCDGITNMTLPVNDISNRFIGWFDPNVLYTETNSFFNLAINAPFGVIPELDEAAEKHIFIQLKKNNSKFIQLSIKYLLRWPHLKKHSDILYEYINNIKIDFNTLVCISSLSISLNEERFFDFLRENQSSFPENCISPSFALVLLDRKFCEYSAAETLLGCLASNFGRKINEQKMEEIIKKHLDNPSNRLLTAYILLSINTDFFIKRPSLLHEIKSKTELFKILQLIVNTSQKPNNFRTKPDYVTFDEFAISLKGKNLNILHGIGETSFSVSRVERQNSMQNTVALEMSHKAERSDDPLVQLAIQADTLFSGVDYFTTQIPTQKVPKIEPANSLLSSLIGVPKSSNDFGVFRNELPIKSENFRLPIKLINIGCYKNSEIVQILRADRYLPFTLDLDSEKSNPEIALVFNKGVDKVNVHSSCLAVFKVVISVEPREGVFDICVFHSKSKNSGEFNVVITADRLQLFVFSVIVMFYTSDNSKMLDEVCDKFDKRLLLLKTTREQSSSRRHEIASSMLVGK